MQLCNVCKQKPAKVHLTQITGGKMQKVDLCEECAKLKGVNDPTGFYMADMLLGIGASQEFEQGTGGPEGRCPKCGFTQVDFKKSGRLGCPDCYTTFADGLQGLLKTMHKGPRHVGKVPAGRQRPVDVPERLKALQEKLAKAIEEENFERAALLRDEIKQIGEPPAEPAAPSSS